MSGKQNKRLRKLFSANTENYNPSKQQINRLKKAYNNLSSGAKGIFLAKIELDNQKLEEFRKKTLDGGQENK